MPPMKMGGDVIQVEMEGQTFDVTVPRGVRSGQVFEVELPIQPPPSEQPQQPQGGGRRWGSSTAGGASATSYSAARSGPPQPQRYGSATSARAAPSMAQHREEAAGGDEEAHVDITVDDVTLDGRTLERSRPRPRRCAHRGLRPEESDDLRDGLSVPPGRGGLPMRLGWSSSVRVGEGLRSFDALARAVETANTSGAGRLDFFFVVEGRDRWEYRRVRTW